MYNEALETAIENYITVVKVAKTDQVADWDVEFVQKCMDWCIFIETEMSVLSAELREAIFERAKQRNHNGDGVMPEQLLDALHHLFYLLLDNVYLNNEVYLFVVKNYHFLTKPDQKVLCKDLTELSRQSATSHILNAMLEELNSD